MKYILGPLIAVLFLMVAVPNAHAQARCTCYAWGKQNRNQVRCLGANRYAHDEGRYDRRRGQSRYRSKHCSGKKIWVRMYFVSRVGTRNCSAKSGYSLVQVNFGTIIKGHRGVRCGYCRRGWNKRIVRLSNRRRQYRCYQN